MAYPEKVHMIYIPHPEAVRLRLYGWKHVIRAYYHDRGLAFEGHYKTAGEARTEILRVGCREDIGLVEVWDL
jgi:hypothetical protein